MTIVRGRGQRHAGFDATIDSMIRLVMASLAIAALFLTRTAAPSRAEEIIGRGADSGLRLYDPLADMIGASTWMMLTEQRPRLLNNGPGAGPSTAVPTQDAHLASQQLQPMPDAAQSVPVRSATPAFSRNQLVTRQLGLVPLSTQPHIAVDPLDSEHLVLAVVDHNLPTVATYVSFDGGETWDGPHQVRYFQDDVVSGGDPVVAFDRNGTVYVVSISLGVEPFRLGTLVPETEYSRIVVSRSEDGGLTWSDAISTVRSNMEVTSFVDETGSERGEVAIEFLDKPWIAIGPDPRDAQHDNVYVAYTEFKTRYSTVFADELPLLSAPITESTIRLVRSTDGGQTWSEPIGVSPTVLRSETAGGELDRGISATGVQLETVDVAPSAALDGGTAPPPADQAVQGPQPAVLSDGTVVVAYLDSTEDGVQKGLATVQVARSRDGGRTFEEPVQAGAFREIHAHPRTAFFRWWSAAFPQVATGPDGEIYIAVTARPVDNPADDGDIFLLRSLDRGQDWETPMRVNADGTDRIQFFPAIDVSPDGVVHAMWGDMRDDPEEVRYHIYFSESHDQGATWEFVDEEIGLDEPDTRVTDVASNSLKGSIGGQFLGDHFAIASTDNDSYLAWADTRLGEFDGPNQQVGFARKRAIAAPSLTLNPASGVAGSGVVIQGSGFQPGSVVGISVGGVSLTSVRADDRGGFEINTYMPVTVEGSHDVTAADDTGNVATALFLTEFGFDSIERQLAELEE